LADRALVTGASGFVGSHLARRLLELGHDVVAVVGPTSDAWRLDDVLSELELIRADIRTIRPAAARADDVYHLAAAGVTERTDTAGLVETNVIGTVRALELAVTCGARRFVYCGSCFEYGPGERHRETDAPNPPDEYAASKSAGWLLARATGVRTGLPVSSVRPFTVYGPCEDRRRLVPSTVLAALRGQPVRVTSGLQSRDFVWIGDAVDALIAAGTSPGAVGLTFNICTGVSTAVSAVAGRVVELSGSGVEVVSGALPDRVVEYPCISGDPTHTAAVLGWRAQTPLDEGLRHTIEWFRESGAGRPAYAIEAAR
jgi:nucleoside-diphosphate-sugar epimerase